MGNLAGSFFHAIPDCASLSRTGVNASGGARSWCAGVYAGLLLALVLFGYLSELIPMTGLAELLTVIGVEIIIKEGRILRESFRLEWDATMLAVIVIIIVVFHDLTVAILGGVI